MSSQIQPRIFSPAELEDWRKSIFDIYDRMRRKADKPYNIHYGGVTFTVFPNVYAPEFFDDSLWYAQALQEIVGTGSLLEIGTGTGIISIFCAKKGAKVVATDVVPEAVANARANAERYNLDISVRELLLKEGVYVNDLYEVGFRNVKKIFREKMEAVYVAEK